jgi:epoxyqueuosine reductase QueG
LLLNVSAEGDPIARYRICKEDCNTCINKCPAKALDGKSVVQKLCREKSQLTTPKGYSLYVCNTCRTVCPSGEGSKRKMGRSGIGGLRQNKEIRKNQGDIRGETLT